MGKIKTSKWDPAEIIETKEDVLAFLEGAFEENDPEFLFKTIGYIARSKGMAQIAKELNLNREGLYTALSPQGNPSFVTVARVLDNLGFRLSVKQKAESSGIIPKALSEITPNARGLEADSAVAAQRRCARIPPLFCSLRE